MTIRPQRLEPLEQATECKLGVGLTNRHETRRFELAATFDARQIPVVSEHMHAAGELALERLRVAQCRVSLCGQPDVGQHQGARRAVFLHELDETTLGRRGRFP